MSAGGGISSPISLPSREGTGVGINSLIASSPVTITDPAAAASYEGIGNTTGGPRGIRGRQNGGPSSFGNDWWKWLDNQYNTEDNTMPWGSQNADGTWCLTYWDLKNAYQAWCDYMRSTGMAGALPSEDVWIAWFMNSEGSPYEGNNGFFQYVPIGDTLPLLAIALLYALILAIKSKLFKSLFTTERSE
jgi:hypothetical protein